MKHNLLIVDDDIATRSFLKYLLQKRFSVKTCTDGYQAMQWLEEGNFPNAIISDIHMPIMHGLDLTRFVRSSGFFRHIPIIILSGSEDDKLRKNAYEEKIDLFIQKPFDPNKLIDQVGALLNNKIDYA